jgi:hypothetical protein
MSNIIDFKPKADLDAAQQLDAFIAWAKATLPKGIPDRVHASIRWEMDSWHQSGMASAAFTAMNSLRKAKSEDKQYMQPPFLDFAKAILVYRRVYLGKKSVYHWLHAMKALEFALVELTGTRDVTQVSAAVCNRACEHMQAKFAKGNNAYIMSTCLNQILKLMVKKGLLAKPFRWNTPLKGQGSGTLKKQRDDREKKLPSRESILALGELFNNHLTNPLDIVVTSGCALLLSQPARIGELADVVRDPIVFKEKENGDQRMCLRWYAEKGFGATIKPVVTGMESVVERVIEKMLPITEEAREYAAWLEDHPDEFPPHQCMPKKGLDDPLTYAEVCSALKIAVPKGLRPRGQFKIQLVNLLAKRKALSPAAKAILDEIQNGWDTSRGRRIYVPGIQGIQGYEFEDKAIITLRKLNILVREKYLPKDFPYTTPPEDGKPRIKYRDALFTVRTGALNSEGLAAKADFGVEIAANRDRMTVQLSSSGKTKGIFERHGYIGVKVNTHAFRHELNTEMHDAGLSQLLIDAFSGRTSMGSTYNHETVESRTQAVADVHPKTKQSDAANRLEKIRTNTPLSLTDITELAEGEQNRVTFEMDLGRCVHDWASEPCPKMGSCLRCGKLACVKGEEEKLKNIKEERDYLRKRYRDALAAESRGDVGATNWVNQVRKDLLKCDALIKLLENPELEDGDVVWNSDDGWNLTNNAAVMAGLVEAKVVEARDQEALPSLDELSALNDEIEV